MPTNDNTNNDDVTSTTPDTWGSKLSSIEILQDADVLITSGVLRRVSNPPRYVLDV